MTPALTASAIFRQILPFSRLDKKRVEVVFDEPQMSSDAGAILFREEAQRNDIIRHMASVIKDERHRSYVEHTLEELLTQRAAQIAQGYEDANDCNTLRHDPVLKVTVGRDPLGKPLASQPTMTRLENSVTVRDLIRIGYVFLQDFLDSYEDAPKMMVIDMDPTPNRVYGGQQLGFFNAHYDQYCLMPFHVYEGLTGRLITTVIRPGKTPTDKEILAILKRIVKGVRDRYPDCKLLLRADSHHTKPAVLDWIEEHGLWFALGMATNKVLQGHTASIAEGVRLAHERTWKPCRRFHSFQYAAGTWSREHRIIARAEATEHGVDVRYIVTNLNEVSAKYLYEDIVTVREPLNELVSTCIAGCAFRILAGRFRIGVGDVAEDGVVEQERILQHDGHAPAHGREGQTA